MKNLFRSLVVSISLTAAFLIAPAPESKAQNPVPYTLLNGGTNKVLALATNQSIFLNVSEFNDLGLQFGASSISGSTSNIQVNVWRSLNTTDYETTPMYQIPLTLAGTATNFVITNLTVGGAASLKIQVASTNAAGFATNLQLIARFKAPKVKLSGS